MRKTVGTRSLLSNTIKDTSTIMRNPLPELCRERLRMIVLVSLIVLLRRLLVPSGTSLHQHSFSRMIFTLVSRIFACICSCAHAQMYGAAPCHHVLSAVKMASCLVARRIQCSVPRLVTA